MAGQREGMTVTALRLALADERSPCGTLDATVTMNGLSLPQPSAGALEPGWHFVIPTPGGHPPSFMLDRTAAAQPTARPLEVVIESGDERVVCRSDSLSLARADTVTATPFEGPRALTPQGVSSVQRGMPDTRVAVSWSQVVVARPPPVEAREPGARPRLRRCAASPPGTAQPTPPTRQASAQRAGRARPSGG